MPASFGLAPKPLQRAAALALAALAGGGAASGPPAGPVSRGDAAWQRRAEGSRGGRAASEPIAEAVTAYEEALAEAPGCVETRARLLRALYFQGQFAAVDVDRQRAIHARGRELAEEGIARLAAELGRDRLDPATPATTAAALATRPDSAALFFWAAAHWGLWGETGGLFTAARRGVAARVRDHAETAILIDETYESGGGLRIRGRLHTKAPRIPLVTGWVDRDLAVSSLERAMELAPRDPLNRLYLAEALLRFRPRRRGEARALLEELLAEPPRAGWRLEDEATLGDARALLAEAR